MAESISLDDRMKSYELDISPIPAYMPYIIRFDGKKFSAFTAKYFKNTAGPFNNAFTLCMIKTMNALLEKTTACTGYTHSDEITLIFAPICTKCAYDEDIQKYTHEYGGRALKNCTTLAALCSVKFNQYVGHHITIDDNNPPYFDARMVVLPVDNPKDLVNHMLWRSTRDCYRNTVSAYARFYFGSKKVLHKHSGQMIEMMKEWLDWESVPIHLKYGVYAKKADALKEKKIHDKTIIIPSNDIINKCFKIEYLDEIYEMLIAKKWTPSSNNFIAITQDLQYYEING